MNIRIICAANHYNNGDKYEHQPKNIRFGLVLCGLRHHNIIANFCHLTGEEIGDNCIQGFLTSDDRFVDREEAGVIAFAANQTSTLIKRLHSEDLY